MKAIVTGASGFVGHHLCSHLQAQGDEVIGLDRSHDATFDVVDRQSVFDAFAGNEAEVIYHLAAASHVGRSWEAPVETLRVNVEGTQNVLDAARAAGVRRVLVVGSAEEYGLAANDWERVSEDAMPQPSTPYGASKVAASFLGLQAYVGTGQEVIRTRSFNHTGPGQVPDFVVPSIARRIAEAERSGTDEITVGRTDTIREVNDVRDVVRAYRLLVLRGEPGTVYNVCSGVGLTIGAIVDRLLALARRPLRACQDPRLVRAVDVPRLVGDPTRLQAATAWAPLIPLDTTLADVLAEARQSRE